MNERIKELAKQAGCYQEQDYDGTWFLAMAEGCWEKFAELIRADERSDLSDLRDKFACAAMAAFINALDPLPNDDLLAKYAYETADAMLKARGEVK